MKPKSKNRKKIVERASDLAAASRTAKGKARARRMQKLFEGMPKPIKDIFDL